MAKKYDTAGQPPFYKTPEELQIKFDEYLEHCKTMKEGVTITGACLFMGFCSRQSFYDYEKREKFSYTIKKIHLHIEHAYENRVIQPYPTGAIFMLKNLGYKDTQEIDHKGQVNIHYDKQDSGV